MAEKKPSGAGRKPKAAAPKAQARRSRAPAQAAGEPIAGEISPEQRWRMVAEAAYYIAEKRGFVGGDPGADWFQAEQQVDAFLRSVDAPPTSKPSA